MNPTALCLFAQTDSQFSGSIVFGDGIRCVAGLTKRLATEAASGGSAAYPGPGDPSISARSAALGDPIGPGDARNYFVYCRDPNSGWACTETLNATNALRIQW